MLVISERRSVSYVPKTVIVKGVKKQKSIRIERLFLDMTIGGGTWTAHVYTPTFPGRPEIRVKDPAPREKEPKSLNVVEFTQKAVDFYPAHAAEMISAIHNTLKEKLIAALKKYELKKESMRAAKAA